MNSNNRREDSIKSLLSSNWPLEKDFLSSQDDYTLEFSKLELTGENRELENYIERIKFHGLTGCENVLDFGCGIGQWSIALSKHNKKVLGIDKNEARINFANHMASNLEINNVEFSNGDELFSDSSVEKFDAVICYSVLMFVDGPLFISRFNEILKPGGKLYVMVDLVGWSFKSLIKNPRSLPGFAFLYSSTLIGKKKNIIYSKSSLNKLLNSNGFEVKSDGADGESSFVSSKGSMPFLENKFGPFQTLYEICAIKR